MVCNWTAAPGSQQGSQNKSRPRVPFKSTFFLLHLFMSILLKTHLARNASRHVPATLYVGSSSRYYATQQQQQQRKLPVDFSAIESKWQHRWKENAKTPKPVDTSKPNYYTLSMFPYPSGMLHMGHVRVYAISDTIQRFRKMYGYNVLHPMGWDAFGLPAENAAIERGIHPSEWTTKNIAIMKEQMSKLCIDFDWSKVRPVHFDMFMQTWHSTDRPCCRN